MGSSSDVKLYCLRNSEQGVDFLDVFIRLPGSTQIKLVSVLSQKDYWTRGGGKTAAILYTLIGSCKANNINPYEYLKDVLARINTPPYSKLYELLPHNWEHLRQQK